ncbi:MAG TPA: DUF429 domain-containing protein [Fimbriimonadaceae bacterium]|nr:DUF429 domain-containing protein [Fimbriimonadaceae bacterium]
MLIGIDGCPNAWIAITFANNQIASERVTDLAEFIDRTNPKVVAIDIPIGLVETGSRTCDIRARELLGRRKSSVFPAPILPAIAAKTRETAHEISITIHGKGVGAQSFGIYAKVKEVDDLLNDRPDLRERIYEVHPELCFYALNGDTPMEHPKRTGPGFMERIALVTAEFGKSAFDDIRAQHPRSKVADDDILDAFAALWTAKRISVGRAACVPNPPSRSTSGIPMAIWR